MHTIRLRAPWKSVAVGGQPGSIRYSRVFHQPTGLTADSRVWLVIDDLPSPTKVTLNGQELAFASPALKARYDITALLAPSNELVIEIASSPVMIPAPSEPPAQVRLEIEAQSEQRSAD